MKIANRSEASGEIIDESQWFLTWQLSKITVITTEIELLNDSVLENILIFSTM